MPVETCQYHALVEDRLQRHEVDYKEVAQSIENLQNTVVDEMEKLNRKIETIHTRLVGDLDGNTIGWVQKINSLEVVTENIKKVQEDMQHTISGILPWFSVFKWMVITIAPTFILGLAGIITGLLTGKIKIIM